MSLRAFIFASLFGASFADEGSGGNQVGRSHAPRVSESVSVFESVRNSSKQKIQDSVAIHLLERNALDQLAPSAKTGDSHYVAIVVEGTFFPSDVVLGVKVTLFDERRRRSLVHDPVLLLRDLESRERRVSLIQLPPEFKQAKREELRIEVSVLDVKASGTRLTCAGSMRTQAAVVMDQTHAGPGRSFEANARILSESDVLSALGIEGGNLESSYLLLEIMPNIGRVPPIALQAVFSMETSKSNHVPCSGVLYAEAGETVLSLSYLGKRTGESRTLAEEACTTTTIRLVTHQESTIGSP